MKDNQAIGIFNDGFPPIIDGVSTAVVNYADYLHRHGAHPYVITPSNPVAPPDVPYPLMRYFSLPIRGRRPYRYGYPKLDFKIWRALRHAPFSLVHSHSPFSAGRLALYTARKRNIPVIGTFHSKYRTDLEHSFPDSKWIVRIIMKRILDFYNACDRVWIPQRSVEDTVREYGFKGTVEVVENGNDLAYIRRDGLPGFKNEARDTRGIAGSKIVLLFVGQHIWEKGIGVVLDAVELLKGKGLNLHLDFVGDGYARGQLIDRVRAKGLENEVTVHGVITDRTLLALMYASADLFLFPSFYDNAPIVVREAAAMATPSVLPAGCTAAEVIADGRNGFLCERSAESYAAVVERLAAERGDILAAGLRARDTLARSWEDVMAEVLARYKDIINVYKR